MSPRNLLIGMLIVLGVARGLVAQAPVAAPALPRYPEIKTQFNQSLSQALTNEQRLDLFRQTVAQGRHSGRPMLKRMFGNFEPGSFNLSSTTAGLDKTVRLLASDNRNVVIGNARTLRYAMSINSDSRFTVIGLNQPRSNSAGNTDADIVFRHKPTGLQVRMEVKNMSLASQRANFDKIKQQLLKMAEDARRTGEMQVWANRQKVLPEVRAFAERHGIRVEERLRTGNTNLRPGDRSFQDFANDLDKELRLQAKLTAWAGSLKAGMGAYLVYQAIRQLKDDVSSFAGTHGDWLRIGEHGSTLLAGSGFASAGAAQIARRIPALANSARLISLARWGGRLGLAGTVLAEGFLVSQYLSGDLSQRQFWVGQASLGGGLAGSVVGGFVGFKAGALTGGAIGSAFGPAGSVIGAGIGATVGTIAGGVGGGYAGAHFAGRVVENRYRLQDAEQQEKYAQFLLKHYQSR
ncbi:MAG: hypothetical protein KatS3mg105_4202 [Gemmatales bacterium]|nr:MAG: hypothetical protein KatS3mg105_4202 [Gemmatales bacterium]